MKTSGSDVRFITFTGRPGSGKGTLVKGLLERRKDLILFRGKSVTTRAPHPRDVPGEYEYVSLGQFDTLKKCDAFAWTVQHSSNWYGTRNNDVKIALRSGKVSIMTLVPDMVVALRGIVGDQSVLSFYIDASEAELLPRMLARGETREVAERRIAETEDWIFEELDPLGIVWARIMNPNENSPGRRALIQILSSLADQSV